MYLVPSSPKLIQAVLCPIEACVRAEEIAEELQDLAFMEGAAPTAKAVPWAFGCGHHCLRVHMFTHQHGIEKRIENRTA